MISSRPSFMLTIFDFLFIAVHWRSKLQMKTESVLKVTIGVWLIQNLNSEFSNLIWISILVIFRYQIFSCLTFTSFENFPFPICFQIKLIVHNRKMIWNIVSIQCHRNCGHPQMHICGQWTKRWFFDKNTILSTVLFWE